MKNKQDKPKKNHSNDRHLDNPTKKVIITDNEIAEILKQELGNISAVAKRLKVERQTIYNRIDKSDFLKETIKNTRQGFNDGVENNILRMLQNTDISNPTPAQISLHKYYAGTQMRDRGYGSTQQIDLKADVKANVTGQLDLGYMDTVEKSKLLEQLKQSDDILNSLKNE